MPYASGTEVPIERSRLEVEKLLRAAGGTNFFTGEVQDSVVLGCRLHDRFIKFNMPYPTQEQAEAALRKQARFKRGNIPSEMVHRWISEESRRRWRCLVVMIKAKLAAVQASIRTFEQEFLADIMVGKDGTTVYDQVRASIEESYTKGVAVKLLPEMGPG